MGIPGRGGQAFMPCGLLDKMSRCAMVEGMGDVSMPEPMRGDRGGDPGPFCGGMNNTVDGRLIEKPAFL